MKSIQYAERDIKLFVDVFPQATEIEYEGHKLSDVVRLMLIEAYREGWEDAQIREGSLTDANGKH